MSKRCSFFNRNQTKIKQLFKRQEVITALVLHHKNGVMIDNYEKEVEKRIPHSGPSVFNYNYTIISNLLRGFKVLLGKSSPIWNFINYFHVLLFILSLAYLNMRVCFPRM